MMGQREAILGVASDGGLSLFAGRNRSNGVSGNYLDIFYHNIPCLRTKFIEIFLTMCLPSLSKLYV
jgi:hypothetical protein